MPQRVPFLLVGAGKMGEAILGGWIGSQEGPAASLGPDDFVAVNPGQERRDHIGSTYEVRCVADVSQAPAAQTVILAVKPQVMMGVLEQISTLPAFQGGPEGPLFISIAAGLGTDALASALPQGAPLVRVMPNTPLQVGAGATAVCGSPTATAAQVQEVCDLFGSLGTAVAVEEGQMDAVCALSGSGPAYVAAMIEALTAAAVQEGLEESLAERLALQTVLGTARLIDETAITPEQARLSVCSPGGTTLAALEAMEGAGFDDVFALGVHAAAERSKELAQCTR